MKTVHAYKRLWSRTEEGQAEMRCGGRDDGRGKAGG